MSSYRQWIIAAGAVGTVICPAWAGTEKPAGGICECAPYAEAPTLCAPLAGTNREACITGNTRWLNQCVAWRNDFCRAPANVAGPAKAPFSPIPAAPAVAATPLPQSAPFAAAPAAPTATVLPAVAKFGGAWAGEAQCRMATDKWRLTMEVGQTGDGSLLANARTSQAFGSFSRSEFKDNQIILHFDNWLSETVYVGHLAGPNRIEGTVRVAGSDCKWYMTR